MCFYRTTRGGGKRRQTVPSLLGREKKTAATATNKQDGIKKEKKRLGRELVTN
jgi:hypothetical protein